MAETGKPSVGIDTVDDEEVLFRRVENDPFFFKYNHESGELFLTHHAFRDASKKPSVDRAKLCNHDPKWTQWDHNEAGVVSLVAHDVRLIDPPIFTNDNKGRPITKHNVDVLPDPIIAINGPGGRINHAHAQITLEPEAKGGAFDRLQIALSKIAQKRGWLINPLPHRGAP